MNFGFIDRLLDRFKYAKEAGGYPVTMTEFEFRAALAEAFITGGREIVKQQESYLDWVKNPDPNKPEPYQADIPYFPLDQ